MEGFVHPDFAPVATKVQSIMSGRRASGGMAVAVYHHGELVVDGAPPRVSVRHFPLRVVIDNPVLLPVSTDDAPALDGFSFEIEGAFSVAAGDHDRLLDRLQRGLERLYRLDPARAGDHGYRPGVEQSGRKARQQHRGEKSDRFD